MRHTLWLCAVLLTASCGTGGGGTAGDSGTAVDGGGAPGNDGGSNTGQDGGSVGSIDTAAAKYPDMSTMWTLSIQRTCGPNGGVCHNNRQFPDMQTSANFLEIINTRCNQIRGSPSEVDNLCEPLGDELHIGTFVTHIGNVQPVTSGGNITAVTLTLKDAIVGTGAMSIVRPIAGLPTATINVPAGAVQSAAAGAKLVTLGYPALQAAAAPGGTLATFLVPTQFLPGDTAQVEMGDPNGDGLFGFDLGGALVKPGAPLKSYLFLRVMSAVSLGNGQTNTNMTGPASKEAQMPIANLQYWDIGNDTLALWCWISGLTPNGSNATAPIDYAHCDTRQMPAPNLQGGEATTWSQIWSTILQPQCASCHFRGTTQNTTLYMDDPLRTYDVLLGIAGTGPSESPLPFVTRADPSKSYLYLKVAGDPRIVGARMPLYGQLSQSAIDSIGTWITQGAVNN